MDQDCLAGDGTVGENGAMRRDARNSKAGAHLVAHVVRKLHGLLRGDDSELRSRSERPVGLSAVHPDTLTDPRSVHALTHALDDPRAIAVGNDARKREAEPNPVAALLRVSGVDPRKAQAHADLGVTRFGRIHLPNLQDLRCRSPSLVPSRKHDHTSVMRPAQRPTPSCCLVVYVNTRDRQRPPSRRVTRLRSTRSRTTRPSRRAASVAPAC